MSDELPAAGRVLPRNLTRPPEAMQEPATTVVSEASARYDISAILDAVQYAATSMTSMAERIQKLEAHVDAFDASNAQLQEQNGQLGAELNEAVQQRNSLTARLAAENERSRRLEALATQQIARGTALADDLETTGLGLRQIVESVVRHLQA